MSCYTFCPHSALVSHPRSLSQERLERERALSEAVDLEKKEEEFHVKQARVRASLRIAQGRSRPIDLLAANMSFFAARAEAAAAPPGSKASEAPAVFNWRLEPEHLCDNLSAAELADLQRDVAALMGSLDAGTGDDVTGEAASQAEFWHCFATICAWERNQAERREAADRAAVRGLPPPQVANEPGLHASLDEDVARLFVGKSYGQLLDLRAGVADSLASGTAAEPEYWQAVLRRCDIALAKARVKEIHDAVRSRAEAVLAQEAGLPTTAHDLRAAMGWDDAAQQYPAEQDLHVAATAPERPLSPDVADARTSAAVEASDGRFSPLRMEYIPREDLGLPVVDAAEDAALLEARRAAVQSRLAPQLASAAMAAARSAGPSIGDAAFRAAMAREADAGGASGPGGPAGGATAYLQVPVDNGAPEVTVSPLDAAAASAAYAALRAQAARVMGSGEGEAEFGDNIAAFGGEVSLHSSVYWWHDKYRPRKPQYYNRIHTGYEWNKYNQTHYDHDNPPPKTVQGYKFNIFYPDLIDKTKAPSFTIEPDPAAGPAAETCIIRFTAGPPYEDIAFRIVNKEWEQAAKRGFKCSFERGILHLYVNFVRPRYRR